MPLLTFVCRFSRYDLEHWHACSLLLEMCPIWLFLFGLASTFVCVWCQWCWPGVVVNKTVMHFNLSIRCWSNLLMLLSLQIHHMIYSQRTTRQLYLHTLRIGLPTQHLYNVLHQVYNWCQSHSICVLISSEWNECCRGKQFKCRIILLAKCGSRQDT